MSKMRKYEPLFLTLNPRIHGNLCIEQRYFGAPENSLDQSSYVSEYIGRTLQMLKSREEKKMRTPQIKALCPTDDMPMTIGV